MPSSISSSRSIRVPKAGLGAVMLFVGLEVALRTCSGPALLPCTREAPDTYDAIRLHLERWQPVDLAIVGSSRAREAFDAGGIRSVLAPLRTVGNFAASGARATEVELIVEEVLKRDPPPKIMIYGVSPYQLSMGENLSDLDARFWSLRDWWDGWAGGRTNTRDLAAVLRTSLARRWFTFALRPRFREFVGRGEGAPQLASASCHIRGDLTPFQTHEPTRSLRTRPVSAARVRRYLERCMVGAEYPFDPRQAAALDRVVETARKAGVPIVLAVLPLSDILVAGYPPGTRERFDRHVEQVSQAEGVLLLRASDVELGLDDFLEQSHLNLRGARRYTQSLIPRLRELLGEVRK